MATQEITIKAQTEQELDAKTVQISKENPTKVVTVYARLGIIEVYLYDRQPRTDTADTLQTYRHWGGFLKNGKVIEPTKTWHKRHNFCPSPR